MASPAYFLGVDVGTGSVPAGVFDASGVMHGNHTEAIAIFRPAEDFVEQSSAPSIPVVGVSVIEAHAGGIGLLGGALSGESPTEADSKRAWR